MSWYDNVPIESWEILENLQGIYWNNYLVDFILSKYMSDEELKEYILSMQPKCSLYDIQLTLPTSFERMVMLEWLRTLPTEYIALVGF